MTTNNGTVCYDADFDPYGGEHPYTNTCSQNYKFEGKERDTETGNDDFGARYYTSRFGRWLSADWSNVPVPVPYANLTNPQTLNLYAMVSDDPETSADLDGHTDQASYGNSGAGVQTCASSGAGASGTTASGCGNNASASQVQNQNQQKYDPAKSGPEDPANPGKPLSQNAVVKKASDEAFQKTTNGQARSGLAEAGFAVEYKDGKVSIANKVDSVNESGTANQLHIKTDANTIAVVHTHGNKALSTPSPGDLKSPIPNFVRSQRELYVTVPGTTTYIKLDSPNLGVILMILRITATCVLLSCLLFAATVSAQPGDRRLDMKTRVLDLLFPLNVTPEPYFAKMILRFGDSDTQLVVVVYPGGKSELIRFSLAGTSSRELSHLISKMTAENPTVREQEIAAKLKVDVTRSPIEHEAFNRVIDELKVIRISPVLANRVAVDESSEYEFWYDTWQESVHYTITGPFGDDPQDQLGRWMIKFKVESPPDLLRASSAPKP